MNAENGDILVSVQKPGTWARRLTITVPAERVARARRRATDQIARKVRLPGFRAGKIPPRIMEQRFGAAIEQEALEQVMGDAYREAVRREHLQPITQGAIENISYAAGTDLTFDVDLEVRPEIELNVLGGFEIERSAPAVTDAAIDEVLDRLRDEQAVWQPLEAAPSTGDMAVVEITPLDSPADVEPKPRRYQLVLGEGQALPAIEDAVRTLVPGTDAEFTVALPEDADDPVRGSKEHRLHIRMLEAKRPERPTLDDEFARSLGAFADLAELRARIRADVEADAVREAERGLRQQLVHKLVEANPFEVPRALTDQYLERVLPAREGLEAERLTELRDAARPAAEHAIRRILIVERVAELEGLRATEADIAARTGDIAQRTGRNADELRAQLQKNGRLAEIAEEITEDKVFGYLFTLSAVK